MAARSLGLPAPELAGHETVDLLGAVPVSGGHRLRVVADQATVPHRFGTRICASAPLEKRSSSITSSFKCSSSSANGLRPAPMAIGTVVSWYSSSRARRFHSPESSPNHSNIHSWVPSVLVTKPSRDMTILRTTFLSLMAVETHPLA